MRELTLNQEERARLQSLNRMLDGAMNASEATGLMGLSERHTWRLLAAYRKEGAAALSQGNRRRVPGRTIPGQVKARVFELAGGTRGGLSHARLTEILAEREELKLSRPASRVTAIAAVPSIEYGVSAIRKRGCCCKSTAAAAIGLRAAALASL